MKLFLHGGEIAGGSENEMRFTLGNISSTEEEFQLKNKNLSLLSVHHGTGVLLYSVLFCFVFFCLSRKRNANYLSLHLWFISQTFVFGKHLEKARLPYLKEQNKNIDVRYDI